MNEPLDPMPVDDDRAELFIRLLSQHERSLAAYVMVYIPNKADADDLLQETKLALWRSFPQFAAGSSFGAWARKAAFHRILDFRKRKGRERRRLVFSDSCLELLADTFERQAEHRDQQMMQLSHCLARLSGDHQRIVSLRYHEGLAMEQLAGRIERSVAATYRVLSRIRLALRDCVRGVSPAAEAQS